MVWFSLLHFNTGKISCWKKWFYFIFLCLFCPTAEPNFPDLLTLWFLPLFLLVIGYTVKWFAISLFWEVKHNHGLVLKCAWVFCRFPECLPAWRVFFLIPPLKKKFIFYPVKKRVWSLKCTICCALFTFVVINHWFTWRDSEWAQPKIPKLENVLLPAPFSFLTRVKHLENTEVRIIFQLISSISLMMK